MGRCEAHRPYNGLRCERESIAGATTCGGHTERSTLLSLVATRDAEIAALKAEVERLTEVARLLVGECEEQRECPVCGTDTNVGVCRPSCYVAKMREVLDDKKGEGYLAQAKTIADEVSKWPDWKKAGFRTQTEPAPNSAPLPKPDPRDAEIAALREEARADNADAIEAAVLAQDEIAALKARAEKAEAACAEMRAAGDRLHDDLVLYHPRADVLAEWNTLRTRTDLGAGKVLVEREVVEAATLLITLLDVASLARWSPAAAQALADLDALLKKGGG